MTSTRGIPGVYLRFTSEDESGFLCTGITDGAWPWNVFGQKGEEKGGDT